MRPRHEIEEEGGVIAEIEVGEMVLATTRDGTREERDEGDTNNKEDTLTDITGEIAAADQTHSSKVSEGDVGAE
ncbi:hypothetical protein HKX48_001824, partial [Thoreauomyces humboldtii]